MSNSYSHVMVSSKSLGKINMRHSISLYPNITFWQYHPSQQCYRTEMWDFIFYQCSVLTFILLYWFHKPKDQTSSSPSNPINQQSSSGEKDQLLTSKSVESAEIDASLKNKGTTTSNKYSSEKGPG
ncbi:hypothetical protein EB796_015307 [Bugula neritina]|uniref:Uncharacterized protein n=1 Tax=Bugula neritina TaxID=10212 RepID=A0A7J7JJU3_BUGNE|nr:hypothetical protein EB796_015307 [Bugula neritina]